MGGHHTPKLPEVPDYRIYKVDDAPKLKSVREALAVLGLKDPWLRNEVWKYTEFKYQNSLAKTIISIFSRGFKPGVILGVFTAALDFAFLDRNYIREH